MIDIYKNKALKYKLKYLKLTINNLKGGMLTSQQLQERLEQIQRLQLEQQQA
jgi:hypothetical protein